jgi:hypothetical protein
MKIKHKKTGEIGNSDKMNIHTCCPQEIYVYFREWTDTDYITEYLFYIERLKIWTEFSNGRKENLIGIDNYNEYFFEVKPEMVKGKDYF